MGGTKGGPGSNTLLLGPPADDGESVSYFEWMCESDGTAPTVMVTTRHQPEVVLERCQTVFDAVPPTTDIIAVEEPVQLSSTRPEPTVENGVRLTSIGRGDLTGLGIAVSDAFERSPAGARRRLWFDSITSLESAENFKTVFRFLHLLTSRVENADATAYYHADPTALDAQTVHSLTCLFDDVVEVEQDRAASVEF